MRRRKYEFKPDKTGSGILSKLYVTPKQRLTLLRWTLYALVLLVLSLVQDVILCRFSIFGGGTDLTVCGILLLAILLSPDDSAVFCLISSLLLYFSGGMSGPYAIVYLTFLGVLLNIFRGGYLQKSFGSTILCAGVGLMLYELLIFGTGLFLKQTTAARFSVFCVTGAVSLAFMPLLYPVFVSIGKIGGSSWKD